MRPGSLHDSSERQADIPDLTEADARGRGGDAVAIRRVHKVFAASAGDVVALDDVDLTIRENEFFTLLGPSGCGKTTLLRLIAGFEAPTAGTILLDGQDIAGKPPHHRLVNTVFQNYALFPHMTVAQNVGFGLRMRRVAADKIRARVSQMLSLVQLGGLEERLPQHLSGGQQQRVALARALANHPKVLLLDEPLSALDFKLRKEMRLELKRLQRETGITFVFVTHDQQEALEMSDRIAIMSAGRLQQVGTPEAVYEQPATRFVADFIGEMNFLEGHVTGSSGGRISCRLATEETIAVGHGGPPGGQVVLAVRPERTIVLPAKTEHADNALRGEVVERVYQGITVAYHVRLNGGAMVVGRAAVEGHREMRFTVGETVRVHLPEDAVRVLNE